ncbi:hypothetical protein [Massilia cavernae]|uniref:Uncharacterized protein n=1 Tax=Massilia cavernae TaxID=2320864 RepID=A0A418XT03_9BURK|nr:hypothetical protein [Massilia cavernae]RJG15771.1 hypothetical protein D3872_12050 [Massilia cavernae]
MSKPGKHSPITLAAKRQALLAECALQRINAAHEVSEIMAPIRNVREKVGGNLAIPMSAAGIVVGILANRRKKLVPMLTTAFSLWKLGKSLMESWREHKAAQHAP